MIKRQKISFTIIAHNEEQNIKNCLESIKWADEIILVDCESQDNTVQIAKKYTKKIYHRKNKPNLNLNKSYAIDKAKGDWIFYIDPDEQVPASLKKEIIKILSGSIKYNAFKIPRLNYYLFKFLKHGNTYPDYQLRLFRRNFARFPNRHVHEKLKVKGMTGTLNKPFYHFPYTSIFEYFHKLNFYTDFQARFWFKNRKRISLVKLLYVIGIKANFKFINRYFFKLGFLDGPAGLFAALTNSITIIVSYFKLYELYKNK